jgi:hypothetical protein
MTVRKHDTNLDGTLNDVIVGHDHAVRRDHHAAPLSLGFPTWPLADAATFTTRTLTTEGRTEAIVFVTGDRGAASWLCTSDRAVAANASVEFVCGLSRPPNPNETSITTRTIANTARHLTSPRMCRLVRNAWFDAMCISGRRGDTAVRTIGV